MKVHIDCPCLLQPRPFKPSRQSRRLAGGLGIHSAVVKIDRHACVCFVWVCVCVRLHIEGVLTPSVSRPQAFTHPSNRKGSSQQR